MLPTYSDRVQAILKACRSTEVAGPLAKALSGYAAEQLPDELSWRDVALHACRVLQTYEKVVFVTPRQIEEDTASLRHARGDAYRVVVVPEHIARALGQHTDLSGKPLVTFERYRTEWNASFSFSFVEENAMTSPERQVFGRTQEIGRLAGVDLRERKTAVRVSETMRLNEAGDPVLGMWEGQQQRIVIRRDQLSELTHYAGTLLHEIAHMVSGTRDGSLEFENELSRLLGLSAAAALGETPANVERKHKPGQRPRARLR